MHHEVAFLILRTLCSTIFKCLLDPHAGNWYKTSSVLSSWFSNRASVFELHYIFSKNRRMAKNKATESGQFKNKYN